MAEHSAEHFTRNFHDDLPNSSYPAKAEFINC